MSVAHTREAVTPSFETSVSRRRKRHWKIVRLLLLTGIGTTLVATVVAASVAAAGRVGQQIVQKILKRPEYNVKVAGFLDDDPVVLDESVADVPVLGAESDIVDVIRRNGVSRVILAFSRSSHETVLDVIRNA